MAISMYNSAYLLRWVIGVMWRNVSMDVYRSIIHIISMYNSAYLLRWMIGVMWRNVSMDV